MAHCSQAFDARCVSSPMIFALVCALGAGPCPLLPPCDADYGWFGGAPIADPANGRAWGDSFTPWSNPCDHLCASMKAIAEPKTICWPTTP